jgi:hypothetical protein
LVTREREKERVRERERERLGIDTCQLMGIAIKVVTTDSSNRIFSIKVSKEI